MAKIDTITYYFAISDGTIKKVFEDDDYACRNYVDSMNVKNGWNDDPYHFGYAELPANWKDDEKYAEEFGENITVHIEGEDDDAYSLDELRHIVDSLK